MCALVAAALHSFSLNGGPVLCVPEDALDVGRVPYARNASDLSSGGVPFIFDGAEIRQQIPDYAIDPDLEAYRPASALSGWVELLRPGEVLDLPATCSHEALQSGRYAGHELHTCLHLTVIDDFLVTYWFQERNTKLVPEFDRLLAGKIAEWRANCHATRRL
jgi:hypothetical protein